MISSGRSRRAAAILTAAVLAPTAAIGVSAAGAQDTGSSPPSAQSDRPPRGHGPDLAALATRLGVTQARLKAAFDATRPTGDAQEGARKDGLAADLAKALGVSTDKVQTILDKNRPDKPTGRPAAGTKPAKPDTSALVTALSDGLGIEKATVQAALDKLDAAHKADHAARDAAMAAALAKQLNLSAATVQDALASVRPAAPRG
jgi:hypothetical protein